MAVVETLDRLKFILREAEMPMFTDEQLQNQLDASGSFDMAVYELLLLKAENTGLEVTGLNIQDTSTYFKRLAATYRPHNSGFLGG